MVGKRLFMGLHPEDHYCKIFSVFPSKQYDTEFVYCFEFNGNSK